MKKILLLFVLLISMSSYSQLNRLQVEQKAALWFKNNYVSENFKDPYSYKLLKISSLPRYEYDIYKFEVDLNKYLILHRDSFMYKYYKEKINNSEIIKSEHLTDNSDMGKYYRETSQWSIDQYTPKILNIQNEWNAQSYKSDSLYNLFIKLPKTSKTKLVHYVIFIDCHSNNSYGGQVLGKFSFKYDFISNIGFNVIQTN